ncbi:hypothetical protein K461DRAFT_324476 [Myriangium duriaei CBS 260.36]|uniref:Rhodopsin domain-containing protein n=1 Tax=Myriangium duriaei CBS 260.36 TaxID=1168546 RepID=A0A9P4IV48_9PEZI|nr:hypothetical protein K461DRAFT_324476 [Myriangium duriaei CBS 260.36]
MYTHWGLGGSGPRLLAVGWIIVVLALACTVLRYFTASKVRGRWRWDFIWAALAWGPGAFCIVTYTFAILNGVGNDMANVTYTNVFNAIYYIFITLYAGLIGITFAKLSVIALLLQIEGPLQRRRRTALYVIAIFFSAVNIFMIPLIATQCEPYQRLWYRYLPGSCPRQTLANQLATFQGFTTSVTDLILALWPISIANSLSAPLAVKIKICLLMGISTLPGIVSIIRTTVIPEVTATTNVTEAYANFLMYCALEFGLISILSSIPVLRPIFERTWHKLRYGGQHDDVCDVEITYWPNSEPLPQNTSRKKNAARMEVISVNIPRALSNPLEDSASQKKEDV